MSFPKVLIERDSDSEESSSSEEEEEEDVEEEEKEAEVENDAGEESDEGHVEEKDEPSTSTKSRKKPITISLKKVCKVCKKPGHEAGFRGATYIDCPMKPCFLCKMPGHTTMTCPHRVATEFGVAPAPFKSTHSSLEYVFERQLRCHISAIKPAFVIPNQVNCAVIRYHSRRVTCLEFHPTRNNILISGDKKGQLGVWDYGKVHERTVYENIHGCILNNMKFSPLNDETVYGASSDGTVSSTDLETGISSTLVNLNPDGWQGLCASCACIVLLEIVNAGLSLGMGWRWRRPNSWRMLYGLDMNSDKGILLAADNFGLLYMVDTRSDNVIGKPILIHKKGTKVTGLHCHPLQPDLLLSCGNDHFARIWDMRRPEAGSSIYELPHKRVVNSAYFSPQTGSKILTTSQDNRLRVWDSIFGNLDSPSREIVHSHDFNRHLTAFRAEWDPKDTSESLIVVGRYISENYNGVALHPIDFIDISTGQLVAEVMDPNITTITPVNKLHPRDDVLASGSSSGQGMSRIVLCGKGEKERKGKLEDDSGDDLDDDAYGSKSSKTKKRVEVGGSFALFMEEVEFPLIDPTRNNTSQFSMHLQYLPILDHGLDSSTNVTLAASKHKMAKQDTEGHESNRDICQPKRHNYKFSMAIPCPKSCLRNRSYCILELRRVSFSIVKISLGDIGFFFRNLGGKFRKFMVAFSSNVYLCSADQSSLNGCHYRQLLFLKVTFTGKRCGVSILIVLLTECLGHPLTMPQSSSSRERTITTVVICLFSPDLIRDVMYAFSALNNENEDLFPNESKDSD
ncbi:UNVERIFIED_CONTAM: protein DAMAGED DNA-BINDING 2 [Sesamum calycinum]|uniref:Protein DAMAGED DNA-BINDING 2 n=1 Tax=Sesamum calycinum TaxID=2727403 RepID=A0AAW2SHR5_9LAMI